ncbi:SAM-dependent methyltransferase [Salinibacter sp. 10B]|uniref:class I SAM-dependent methyltransferase n=1 Tax=Salinibacter sp. 10B TaxID=1923971 RepID=UPI000CF4C70B|nr:class I SAM-dependent methyltransferase [Salinibacter sp. 10B]PQJ35955.1 SAM-dependent methyltransferase [Salinibacter sp. 10B]
MNEPNVDTGTSPDATATDHTRSRYDLAAPVYDLMEWPIERGLYRSWRETLWAEVDGPQVLEIGVGTGKNIPYYPEGVHVTAIDLSPGMLKRARRVADRHPEKQVTLREMDAQALDFAVETFDDVVATFVFCSVPDPIQGLREALRVTRSGGGLHLLEHMRASPSWLARLMEVLDGPMHWLTGVHIARQTVQNVEAAGWTLDEVSTLSWGDIYRRITAHKSPD